MTAQSGPEILYCPLCAVPHRMAAVHCDDCGQALHVPLDVGALRFEYAKRKREMAQAALIIVVMLVGSFALASSTFASESTPAER